MNAAIEAVYEHGVLRPKTPLDLVDGAEVEVIVIAKEDGSAIQEPQRPAEILAAIAALPSDPPTSESAGRDHDSTS